MPAGVISPVAESVPILDGIEDNAGIGVSVQIWLDNIFGPDTSQLPAFLGDGEVDQLEFFKGATQTTPNRIAKVKLTYDASINPITEVWELFDRDDGLGTTVVKTLTYTHTWVSNEYTKTVLVVT